MRSPNIEIAIDEHADLGEAPWWDPETDELWWTDVHAGVWHRTDIANRRCRHIHIGGPLTCVLRQSKTVIGVRNDQIVQGSCDGEFENLVQVPVTAGSRLNDAVVGPDRALWVGSFALDLKSPLGSVFRIKDRAVELVSTGFVMSNGMGWSPDATTLYFADSAGILYRARPDMSDVSACSFTPLIEFGKDQGVPDGLAVDDEGCVWLAMFGAGRVNRISPDGHLLTALEIPAPYVTSCAFGPEGSTTLYVTTGRRHANERELEEYPLSGSTFAADVGIGGQASQHFF